MGELNMNNSNNVGELNKGFDHEDGMMSIRLRNMPQTEAIEVAVQNHIEDNDKNVESIELSRVEEFMRRNKDIIKIAIKVTLNALVIGYFIFATIYHEKYDSHCGMEWCTGYGMLVIIIVITYLGLFYYKVVRKYFGKFLKKGVINPIEKSVTNFISKLQTRVIITLLLLAIFIGYVIYDTGESRYRLRSFLGIIILFAIGFLFSKHRSQIKWRTVIVGFILQTILGFICIRWDTGRAIFTCIGDKIKIFLDYSIAGSSFVFSSYLVEMGVFAFALLPTIFFFSFCISILYYLGAMQWFLMKLGWILQAALGTTVCESVIAAANIFLSMSESPLLIRPYVKILTHSEIHSVMTSGFATVSGSVFAAYISFGAEPAHLITASVMAAPASLMLAKLFYPETEESQTKSDNIKLEASEDSSILDAASNGATLAIPLVLGIIANLVAFVSFIAFINGILSYLGMLVGIDDFSLKFVFQYGFMPLAYIIGVPWEECRHVGELIATKTFINEFVAYSKLGEFKRDGLLTSRSSAIATYALCGFANPSSLGIMIAALSTMAPEKRKSIASVAYYAFVSGSFVCFMTASIAGLLMPDDLFPVMETLNYTTTIQPTSLIFNQTN